jgi:hypothetical protein
MSDNAAKVIERLATPRGRFQQVMLWVVLV